MRCSVSLHTPRVDLGAEFVSAEGIMEVARAAEQAGFDAVAVTDHPFPEDEWLRTGGHHALDPFVALAFAAAATTKLRLLTHIYVLPYRNPFITAKGVATLDALSNGRLIFGVAAGYLEPEFQALGVDFAERNELTDEAIRAMKRAWTEEGVQFEGRHFAARGHTMLPRPVQKPHPPIWVGGNAQQAIRRAVELADGWMPFPSGRQHVARRHTPALESIDDLRARIAYAREYAERVGRAAPLGIGYTLPAPGFGTPGFHRDALLEQAAALREAGVTYFCTSLAANSRAEHIEKIARFGEEILSRLED